MYSQPFVDRKDRESIFMKVLLVGGGGREHALAWKIAQSPLLTKLYCAPGNAGMAALGECVPLKTTDIEALVDFAGEQNIDFVVVAPDDPLAMGLVDRLQAKGILAFGPTQAAAEIESSKSFAKNLMQAYNIPTAAYRTFTDCAGALAYIREKGAPIVVKADGLALGKGVVVAQTVSEAEQAVRDMLEGGRFAKAGQRVVIEEFLQGPEVTVLAFVDGETVCPMPSSRDHKRAFDEDQGPNTGGMGAISPAPGYTPEMAALCEKTIFLPTAQALIKENRPFRGVLYFGLMLTKEGPKVIEYNARFGDPECQALMVLLDGDLLALLLAVARGQLKDNPPRFHRQASCCVVLASGGYPGAVRTGLPIEGLDAGVESAVVFHAGTKREDGRVVTAGGRVLGVTAWADSLSAAIQAAYEKVDTLSFEDMHFRCDIGK